jgi:hypothetical protein
MVLALLGSGAAALRRILRSPPRDAVVVLFSSADPAAVRQLDCPDGRCTFLDLEADPCGAGVAAARTVVVTGHSTPPVYLGGSAARLAAAVACFEPELVVLDTCYGFSAPLLDALAAEGIAPLVVGSTQKLPPAGLSYGERFYAGGAAEARMAEVRARSGAHLAQWKLAPRTLRAAEEQVSRWDRDTLSGRLRRLHPNLVEVNLPDSEETLLVPVAPERFRR